MFPVVRSMHVSNHSNKTKDEKYCDWLLIDKIIVNIMFIHTEVCHVYSYLRSYVASCQRLAIHFIQYFDTTLAPLIINSNTLIIFQF